MKVLTYNVGLLYSRLCGRSLLRPADWIAERFARLPEAISALDPDVVLLQEIYDRRHKKKLAATLASIYPYAAVSPRCAGVLPASLVPLSKRPLNDLGFA